MPTLVKQNFKLNEHLVIHSTNSELDGLDCWNLGKSTEHIVDFYIVALEHQVQDNLAVTLPESCLRRRQYFSNT